MPKKRTSLSLAFALFLGAIGLIEFWSGGHLLAAVAAVSAPDAPGVTISANIPAQPGGLVTVPVAFSAGGDSIASVVFSLDYNQYLLTFNPIDANDDGWPDRVKVLTPAMFSTQVSFDPGDVDGELDVVIADFSPPLASISSGVMLEITFEVANTPWESLAFVNFSATPRPSFGSVAGFSIAGSATNGSVLIQGTPRPTVPAYIPMVIKQLDVTVLTATPTASPTQNHTSIETHTPTPTATPTTMPILTATPTPTGPTSTYTPTPTSTTSPSPTTTPTATQTGTATLTGTTTPTVTLTPTSTGTSTPTATPSETLTPTATRTSTVTMTPTVTPTPTKPVCSELIRNGGFESNTDWTFPATVCTAAYSTSQSLAGSYSARVGIIGGAGQLCYSSVYQYVEIPADRSSVDLQFSLHPLSSDTLAGKFLGLISPYMQQTWDAQYVIIYDTGGNELNRLVWEKSNDGRWNGYHFDLTNLRGRTIRLLFGVYNDGLSGTTGMYVDEVSLKACP